MTGTRHVNANSPFSDTEIWASLRYSGHTTIDIHSEGTMKKPRHQPTDGWVKPSGKGWIVYLQPGHSVHEYQNAVVAQMVLNAITWKPKS